MAKAQKIGRLRFRLDLLSKSMTSQGNLAAKFNADWNTVVTRDGDIKPVLGAQYWSDRNVEDRITHIITIRYEERFEDRGRLSHIRHTHTKKYGQFYYIEDASIDDLADTFTLSDLTVTDGDEYAIEFTEMTNTDGNFFLRNIAADTYSLYPTAQDAIDDTNKVDLERVVSDPVIPSRMKVKRVLPQRGIMYEIMRASTVGQRKRFLQFECIELGDQGTYNVV